MDTAKNVGLAIAVGIATAVIVISLTLIRRYNNRKIIDTHQKTPTPKIVSPQKSQDSTAPSTALTKPANNFENDIKEEIYRIKNLSPNQLESHCAKLTGYINLHMNSGSLHMKACEDLKKMLERERQAALTKFKTNTTHQNTNNNNNNNNNNNKNKNKNKNAPKPKP